jgi:hypothetical protein
MISVDAVRITMSGSNGGTEGDVEIAAKNETDLQQLCLSMLA